MSICWVTPQRPRAGRGGAELQLLRVLELRVPGRPLPVPIRNACAPGCCLTHCPTTLALMQKLLTRCQPNRIHQDIEKAKGTNTGNAGLFSHLETDATSPTARRSIPGCPQARPGLLSPPGPLGSVPRPGQGCCPPGALRQCAQACPALSLKPLSVLSALTQVQRGKGLIPLGSLRMLGSGWQWTH